MFGRGRKKTRGGASCAKYQVGRSGKRRCLKLTGDRTPAQNTYSREVSRVAREHGVSAALASQIIKGTASVY